MKFRKVISLLLTLCMLLSWTTCLATAVEPETGAVAPISVTHINPLYADVITEADLVT